MSPLAILKLFKTAKDVHDYVKKPNNLDLQNEMILERLKKIEERLDQSESKAHPPVFTEEERDDINKRLDKIEKNKWLKH